MKTTQPIKFKSKPPVGRHLIEDNQPALCALADEVARLSGTGASAKVVKVEPQAEDVLATYWRADRRIELAPHVAEHFAAAVRKGAVETETHRNAIVTFLHETMHGASAEHVYRRGPSKALEEATTELLAHHYLDSFIKKSLGMRDTAPQTYPAPVYEHLGSELRLGRPVAYLMEVLNFGKVVCYVDGIDLTKTSPGDLNRHVAGRALQVKQQVGSVSDDRRFGMLVRPILDREGVDPSHPRYQKIVESVEGVLREAMVTKTLTAAALDKKVAQAVGRKDRKQGKQGKRK